MTIGTPSDQGPWLLQEKSSSELVSSLRCFWRMPWKCRVVTLKPPEPRRVALFPLSLFFNSTLTLSPSHTTREGPGRAPLKTRTGLVGPPSAILSGASVKSCSSVSLKTHVLVSYDGSLHPVPHFSPSPSPPVEFVNNSQALCMYGYIHFC